MDIKSKGIRYSKATKAAAVLLMWISLAGFCLSGVYIGKNMDSYTSKDFYRSSAFYDQFRNYTSYSVNYAIRLRDEGYIKEGKTLPENTATGPADIGQTEEAAAEAAKGEASIRAIMIDNDIQEFRRLGKELAEAKNYAYVVVDRTTGKYVTNIKATQTGGFQAGIDLIKKQPYNIFMSKDDRTSSFSSDIYRYDNLRETFGGTSFEMYAAVVEPIKEGDAFYGALSTFNSVREYMPVFIVALCISVILGIACFIYLLCVAGRREKGDKIVHLFVDRIYTDVQTVIVILAAVILLSIMGHSGFSSNDYIITGLYIFGILSVVMLVGLTYILSIARRIKSRTLLKHTLVYSAFKAVMALAVRCMQAKTFKISVVVLLLGYGIIGSLILTIATTSGSPPGVLIWLAFNIAALWYISKAMVSLADIIKWVKGISTGNLSDSPDMSKLSPAFSGLAGDIANLQSGLREAVSEAVKGERLKAELITNVSHDLRTPLTSIINYVDLLKKEETDNENIKQYTAVLEEKSSRLKQLTEDLLEASKAASGNISVSFGGIDLYSLMQQAAAEFGEKASEAGLDLRLKPMDKGPLVHADGRLMWRIAENLLSNALKYSQRDSRVYIETESAGTYGVMTIKNISALPLDIPADQLMERFVRGDRSRSEEGSGLGLSIAKSLAEVQGGKLEITIDGDLFKASVLIPLER